MKHGALAVVVGVDDDRLISTKRPMYKKVGSLWLCATDRILLKKMVRHCDVGVVLATLLVLIGQGTALRCWTCSSQTSAYCNDPFNRTEDRLGQIRLQDCDNDRIHSSYSTYSSAVCKKQQQRSGGELVTLRHCDWVTEHDGRENGNCGSATAPNYIRVEYCATCATDGCNGSPKDMLPTIWSSIIPLAFYVFFKKN